MRKHLLWSLATLTLLVAVPSQAQAQVEIGMDAGFLTASIDGVDDNYTIIAIPTFARVGFPVGDMLLVETLAGFTRESFGDSSQSDLLLFPGLTFLFGDTDDTHFYVRGEVAFTRESYSNGSDDSESQFGFGGAAGVRGLIGDSGIFRAEAGFDHLLEKEDDGIPSSNWIRVFLGVSLVVN